MRKSSRNVAPDLAMARSVLANAAKSRDPDAITAARENLEAVKAERLRQDSAALLDSVASRTDVRMLGFAGTTRPSREVHNAVLAAEIAESRRFLQAHPVPSWSDEDRTAWEELLARNTATHEALGCSVADPCLNARDSGATRF